MRGTGSGRDSVCWTVGVGLWLVGLACVLCLPGGVLTAGEDPVETLLATNWKMIAVKVKAKKDPIVIDLLIQGQTKSVELLDMDANNCLVYKSFGQKGSLGFTEATATQMAGILQALLVEESATAAVEHLNIGLLYNIEGKSMQSANEINKAISMDAALDAVAQAQLKALPRPTPPPAVVPVATSAPVRAAPAGSNQEGRQLAALPKITTAVLFNTPEADAIMAATQVFPKNNPWNEDISKLPVLPESDKIVAHIGADKHIHFNQDMNFVIVPPTQARVDIGQMQYKDESDKGPYPIPDNTPIEGWSGGDLAATQKGKGGDRHAVVVDPYNGLEFDFYQMTNGGGKWNCSCEATFDLKSNVMRPLRWTSSDAAGLPILPAIVRFDECERGIVEHALRFTVQKSRAEYIYPARHVAATSREKDAPAMGQRFRLKASVTIPGLSKHAQAVFLALKKYGMIMADNGSDWYLSSSSDKRITGLLELQVLKGSDFEVVQTTPETGGGGR